MPRQPSMHSPVARRGPTPTHSTRDVTAATSVIRCGLLVLMLLSGAASASGPRVLVADWSQSSLADWQPERFAGETRYRPVMEDGQRWLAADAQASASGLLRKQRIDLNRTPYLNWSWRVRDGLAGLDERARDGDDYAARVYVVVSGGALFWRTRALNYVWSGSQPRGSQWANAFTGQAQMLAVRGGDDATGTWQQEKRDVRADLQAIFGERIEAIDAVAIMTDADNSGGRAAADYGPIYFSAE